MRAAVSRRPTSGQAYEHLIAACRESLRRIAAESPCPRVLEPHLTRGKMVRPTIVFAAAGAVGGDPAQMLDAARAVELLHCASLVHDDLVDESAQRRERPAVHVEVGPAIATVLGDYLIARSFLELAASAETHTEVRVARALRVFAEQAGRCCSGEIAELRRHASGIGLDYVSVARRKTASQFVGAALAGAILSGGSDGEIACLRRYANALGVAFQLEDDLRDRQTDRTALRLGSKRGLSTCGSDGLIQAEALRDDQVLLAVDALERLEPSAHRDVLVQLAWDRASAAVSSGRPRRRRW